MGASGSGKSTLLRIIAGLETAEQGEINWDGEDISSVPTHRRNFGLMFQDYALFPHKSVAENVAFGLRMQNLPSAEIRPRVREALEQVNMTSFANRRVTDLSGGEQQRVALARVLAPRPRLLMLDEPLGALDRSLKEQLMEELHRLLRLSQIPAIYVTHDQEEAFTLADRLILMRDGAITQEGSPGEVYRRPASPWVARFLGLDNLLEGEVITTRPFQVKTQLGILSPACAPSPDIPPGSPVSLLIRPNGARLEAPDRQNNLFTGRVEDVVFHGEIYRCDLKCAPRLSLRFSFEYPPRIGDEVKFSLQPDAIICLGENH